MKKKCIKCQTRKKKSTATDLSDKLQCPCTGKCLSETAATKQQDDSNVCYLLWGGAENFSTRSISQNLTRCSSIRKSLKEISICD